MKLYTDLKIPLWNWDEIQKSQIDGDIDLRYLVIDSDYNKPIKKTDQLYESYLNILYQIPGMNIDLNTAWTNYLIERQMWQLTETQNEYARNIAKKEKIIDFNKLERAFINYLDILDSNYEAFEFTIYGLNDDYREKWHYDYDIPNELIDNEKMNFFLFDEFIDMVKDWAFFRALIFAGKLAEFVDRYIYSKEIKYSSIRNVYNTLYDRFREMGQIEKLRIIRDDYFSLYKLKFDSKKTDGILDQVIGLREINNQTIPFSKENSITLDEFLKQIKRVKSKESKKQKDAKKV